MDKMKRRLNKDELNICLKSLKQKENEKDWIEYQILYHNLMLEKGLEMNYKKNIRDFTAQKREFENELKMVQDVINVLNDQIRNGVDIKMKGGENKDERL